ncbi:carbohydrate kinase family protein [Candidatus Saccharibacteria bacterium]|nr:carbohydrate kinase family protein [Candidatus Saccharibacteria bacterium]
MKRVKIVCIGSALQDVYLKDRDDFTTINMFGTSLFDRIELGAKVEIDKVYYSTGGGATNAAATFARQGHEAVFLGVVGRDSAGAAVIDKLDEEGVDTRYVKYTGRYGTGYAVILLAPSGERTILVYRGASNKYDLVDAASISEIQPDWAYLTTMAGDFGMLNKVFAECGKVGAKIMFNPGKNELEEPQKLKALLEDVDVLLVNKEEARKIVHGETLDELAAHLLNYVKVAIISDGENGSMASDGKSRVRAGVYEDVKSVDRTGAGDAFGSGFLSQWAKGKSLRDAVHFASANSTSVVMKIGAKDGILSEGAELHGMPIVETKLK